MQCNAQLPWPGRQTVKGGGTRAAGEKTAFCIVCLLELNGFEQIIIIIHFRAARDAHLLMMTMVWVGSTNDPCSEWYWILKGMLFALLSIHPCCYAMQRYDMLP